MKRLLTAPFRAIERFFHWSSGADLEVLDQVPSEKSKYFGIGGTIVFTALMASFAGGYAFYTAFKDEYLSIFFGMFWGALIFNLDRYIVASFGVGDGRKTISWQEILEAGPRILMAVLLGFVISTPLELKIFEREIEGRVERLKIEEGTKIIEADKPFADELNRKRDELATLESDIKQLEDQKLRLATNEAVFFDEQKKEIEQELTRVNQELANREAQLNRAWRDFNFAQKDTTGRYSAQQIAVYKRTYQNRRDPVTKLRSERDALQQNIKQLEDDRETAVANKRAQIETDLAGLRNRRDGLLEQIGTDENIAASNRANAKKVGERYDGFASHLEAMNALTEEKPAIWWAKWLITALFVFIEIAPILFKMMTERGPYDDIMDRIKHEVKVKQLLEQSNLNQWVNNAVRKNAEENDQLLRNSLASNEVVMQHIADAQAEIARAAVEEWKKEQIKRVRDNPDLIVTAST